MRIKIGHALFIRQISPITRRGIFSRFIITILPGNRNACQ